MKKMWCWRCRREMPMLNEQEYEKAFELYKAGFQVKAKERTERFKDLLDYYEHLTGYNETEPNAIMHHRISTYGPPCEKCSKPYRTLQASFCAACGNKRN